MDYCKIGQRIRYFRKLRRLSQEELAELVDISTTHMSHIETGSTKLSLPVLVSIATALQVQTDDILECGSAGTEKAFNEIAAVLGECTPQEARIISELVVNTKRSLERHL